MCAAAFPVSEMPMKSGTRDNLIYLGVGLGVAALVVADFFYADSHGQEMWMPSRFALRAVYTTLRCSLLFSYPRQSVTLVPGGIAREESILKSNCLGKVPLSTT
jgi:hypothetical protein